MALGGNKDANNVMLIGGRQCSLSLMTFLFCLVGTSSIGKPHAPQVNFKVSVSPGVTQTMRAMLYTSLTSPPPVARC